MRLHADEQLRGACGAPPSLAGEARVGWTEISSRLALTHESGFPGRGKVLT